MSGSRFGRLQKATALVPLALLSAAWTVSVTGLTHTSANASDTPPPPTLPDGTTIPSHAISAPASISSPADSARGLAQRFGPGVVATATASGIPAAALAAYQRAASVIDAADPTCHLQWQLIAAIGRVESNHGRAEGNTLTPQGISTPGIFGPPLDGNGRARIPDTDGGRLDGDTRWDRAVGPMQFIPSTWAIVGVDADGDGQRNPQDINDASLAAAVYLCAGTENLSTPAGQRVAVFRYNHNAAYVTTVMQIAAAYLSGDYASVPNSTLSNDWVFHPTTTAPAPSHHTTHPHTKTGSRAAGHLGSVPTTSTPSQPSQTNSPSSTNPSTPNKPSSTSAPTSAPPLPTKSAGPVVATVAQLTDICTSALKSKYGAAPDKAVQACVNQLKGKTVPQAQAAVGGVVAGLADLVSSLLGGLGGGLLGGS